MRRIVLAALSLCFVFFAQAQDSTAVAKKIKFGGDIRSGDHFMLQLGGTGWNNKPDSIHTKGLSRSFNMYLMMDFPFKTNPKFSVALGPGIATDNIYFNKMYVGIKDNTSSVRFQNLADTNHYKKYKLATAYLEAPVELRYRFNPENDNKSIKLALGVKVGTLLNAHVKGKELQSASGSTLNNYIVKEMKKSFFNKNRLSLTARAGYGHYTLFASYAVTPLFKEGVGPQVRPVTIGIALSGL